MAAPSPAAILVVDDARFNLTLVTHRLKELGYSDIATARNGQEALDAMAKRRFDCVLLDIEMPVLDGYQTLERMRGDGMLVDTPVIVISAVDALDSVARCLQLGAEDYLPKSFDPTILAARLSAVLEKKRLRDLVTEQLKALERELGAARQLQMGMVPTDYPPCTPERPVDIHALIEPAKQVGGDLYDFFYLGEDHFCFCVGDASGKGAPAALFMARTRSVTRSVAKLLFQERGTVDPAQAAQLVNGEISLDNAEMIFMTLFFGLLNVRTGMLQYCNAGHTRPFLVRPGAAPVEVGPINGQMAMGVEESLVYRTDRLELGPSDTLFVYSDGISEALDEDLTLFGEPRLGRTLDELRDLGSAEAINRGVVAKVKEFAGTAPQADDITAMTLRWRP